MQESKEYIKAREKYLTDGVDLTNLPSSREDVLHLLSDAFYEGAKFSLPPNTQLKIDACCSKCKTYHDQKMHCRKCGNTVPDGTT